MNSPGQTPKEKLGILLVDGNRDHYRLVKDMLDESDRNYGVGWVKNGTEAKKAIAAGAYGAFLVGETLDDCAGLEVVWEVSSAGKFPAILFLEERSAKAEQEAINLGAMDCLIWGELSPRFLDRAISGAVARKKYDDMTRNSTESLIQQIIELQASKERYEAQSIEYIQMAEELSLLKNELEQALEEVTRNKEELEYLNGEKDKLFSIIAHDLRSPFTALLGLTQMMSEFSENMEKEMMIDRAAAVHESAKRVFALLENLLEWSRLQRDQVKIRPAPMDVRELAAATETLFSPVAKEKGVSLINDVPDGLKAVADRNTIDTVIRNLVNNAVKFTDQNGAVTISGNMTDSVVEVSVRDTGIGMTEKQISCLFDLAKENTTVGTNGEKGTGLGLLLCKDLVEKNNGEIRVESEAGQGSNFTFTIPAP